jgi:type IV pilus assembly protein PilX
MRRTKLSTLHGRNSGIVLPIALIMLVIISFAGLLAARNSATFEQFSNNMRTNQIARVSAEDALRHCERVAIDSVDGGANFATDVAKILGTEITGDDETTIRSAAWNTKANWATGAANLITLTPTYGSDVQNTANQNPRLRNNPTCIIQALVNDRFLVTTRGLSSDAVVANDGTLSAGSEVWLQSILTPTIPVLSANNGVE